MFFTPNMGQHLSHFRRGDMAQFIYRTDYWADTKLKKTAIDFIKFIHNLDLSYWDKLGYWDDNYRPFSLFDNEKIVAHACLYTMDMMVNGKRCKVAQISAVGTHPDYRRLGLNFELTQKVFEWATPKHDFYYLFADDMALPFYKHCGFRMVDEYKTVLKLEGQKPKTENQIIKLDTTQQKDRDLIYTMAQQRSAASDKLGVFNPKLLMFWCLYFLKDNIYYIPDLDAIIIYSRENKKVTISDVIASDIPSLEQFYPSISDKDDREVVFQFMIDKMKLDNFETESVKINAGTHLMGNFPLEQQLFQFPLTAHA